METILVEELKVNVEGLNVEEIRRIQQVQISYMQFFFFYKYYERVSTII